MECEIDVWRARLDSPVASTLCGYETTEGTLGGMPVVVLKTRVGEINAATAITAALARFCPRAVILAGTAGAHRAELVRGDIILGQTVTHIGAYATDPRPAGAGSDLSGWRFFPAELPSDHGRVEGLTLSCDPDLLALAEAVPYCGGALRVGCVGSGDFWNREVDRILFLHKELGTDCEEMESFAAAVACRACGVPFLAVRVISNNELTGEAYEPKTAQACQRFVLDLVKSIKEK